MNLQRLPDLLRIHDGTTLTTHAVSTPSTRLQTGAGISLGLTGSGLTVDLEATGPISHLQLRWQLAVPEQLYLADHWERAYGDLEWRALVPHRIMPWYFLTSNRRLVHGYGVATGAAAMAYWQVDASGVSLHLDLRNGGSPLAPSGRTLRAATVILRQGNDSETIFSASQDFCRQLCPRPRLPSGPIYGSNNWYSLYGKTTHDEVIEQTEILLDLCPPPGPGRPLPYMIMDDGWQLGTGVFDRPNERFPDMGLLAREIRQRGARPGLWIRPLEAAADVPAHLLLPATRLEPHPAWQAPPCIDPTIPENRQHIHDMVARVREWGFELIKHDYTTYDVTGHWGFQMAGHITRPGWHFADRTLTTAEVILDLYRTIREAARNVVIIGCNTVGHLAAGHFEIQRTGDDTSGRDWERTRAMGLNTLAFRMPQHQTFFLHDADCVGLTRAVPWELNSRFLDLLSRSGTPLFVSFENEALGEPQKAALRQAFARASEPAPPAVPVDTFATTCPSHWLIDGQLHTYSWDEATGTELFPADADARRQRGHYTP